MLAALLLAGIAVATLEGDSLGSRTAEVAAAGVAGLIGLAALATLLHRRPGVLGPLAVAALPFRIPLSVGSGTVSLLVPLYGVIAAAVLALAFRWLRRGTGPAALDVAEAPADRRVRRLQYALAGVLVLYALQSFYSTDIATAVKNACLFYVPFAVLFALLLDVRWSPQTLRISFWLVVGLSLVFALVGFYEYATGHLLLSNAKVQEANDLKPYFRVNSLFFDPNIYGRFLALTMVLLAAALVWTPRKRTFWLVSAALVVLWAGLVISLSQSSFAALLGGLAVLAALRWRARLVLAAAAAAAVVGVAVILLAPGAIQINTGSSAALDKATSGRLDLVRGALSMARDRPVWGFGTGSFAERYRVREGIRSERVAAISHTIPLTVAAEQGVIGLIAYLALMAAALLVLLAELRIGLRRALRAGPPGITWVAAAAVAAAYVALVLHTLVYAAFLEDPLTWTLLAAGGALLMSRTGVRSAVPEGSAPTMQRCPLPVGESS
jgi:O-antigen ligase